jgi:protein TonB
VSFVIDKDGNVNDVKALNDPGYSAASEAVNIIKDSPKWKPAIENGQPVSFNEKQQIVFVVPEY